MLDKKDRGKKGEAAAEKLLTEKGYQFIERNFSCRLGEIDLIMKKDGRLIFVEVKARESDHFAHPREYVTKDKQRKIVNTACIYLKSKNLRLPLRFDVVEVIFEKDFIKVAQINHIENAFSGQR